MGLYPSILNIEPNTIRIINIKIQVPQHIVK